MSKQVNYNENLCAGAAIRDDKGRRISKLFEGSHPKMTVGYAKNLIMPDTPTEQEFNFRQSGGGLIEDGVAVIDKVKGNSVVWNQKVKNATFINTSEWDARYSTFSVSGGIASVTASADGDNYTQQLVPMVVGHKYLYIFMAATDTANKNLECAYIFYGESTDFKAIKAKDDTNWHTYNAIVTCVSNTRNIIRLEVTKVGTSQFKNVSLIDLTQMFGAGNEPTTYEEFLQRKPKVADEYAYNEGTIVNNKMEGVKTTGRNLFDSSTAIDGKTIDDTNGTEVKNSLGWCSTFIPIIGGETYFCKGVRINIQAYGVHYYDKDKQHINSVGIPQNGMTFDAPINAKYIRIHGLYDSSPANTAILNLSDASFNGQYAPYEKHELDLSWVKDIKDAEGVKLFEDGMRSAGTAFDEVGKNKAVKRIAVSTFNGTEDWRINSYANDKGVMAYQCYSKFKPINENIRCDRFVTRLWSSSPLAPMSIFAIPKNGIIIETDGTQSLEDFKASLEAKPLDVYYELAEPIEVEYDEKSLTYPVVAGGTEEAIESEPSSAFRADIGYGIDAVKTILDLKARVEALEKK